VRWSIIGRNVYIILGCCLAATTMLSVAYFANAGMLSALFILWMMFIGSAGRRFLRGAPEAVNSMEWLSWTESNRQLRTISQRVEAVRGDYVAHMPKHSTEHKRIFVDRARRSVRWRNFFHSTDEDDKAVEAATH
jgi:hypothetical protein